MKEFSLVTKLKAEKESKSGTATAKKAEVDKLTKELSEINGVYEQAIFEGDPSEELDRILDSKAVIESKLQRRKNELETINSLNIQYSIGADEFASKFNKEYAPELEKALAPSLKKVEAAKVAYMKALHELQDDLTMVKAEENKAEFFLKQLNSGNSVHKAISTVSIQSEKEKFLSPQDFQTAYYELFR